MLAKLRRKFIIINMFSVGSVILTVVAIVCLNNIVNLTVDLKDTLKKSTQSQYTSVYDLPYIGGDENRTAKDSLSRFSGTVYTVTVNSRNEISRSSLSSVTMSDSVLIDAVEYVLQSDEEFGRIDSMNLFYTQSRGIESRRISFADTVEFDRSVKSILLITGILAVTSMLAVYIISVILAKIAVRPVEKAWIQQQQFLADASHELKTPLTVILANNNILQAHPADTIADQQKWITSTYDEASHMRHLIDELLFLAKSDADKTERVFLPVDFSETAQNIGLQFEPVAYENGVEIIGETDPDIFINADETQLNQLVHILIDNAVKYAGLGGRVEWRLKRISAAKGQYALFTVANTGNPIPKEDLPHIFERFYRSDKARTAGSGYGLGLAIAKDIADNHGAALNVRSNEQTGTEFSVKFKIIS